ncbi:MAG: hypothetical protein H0X14_11260, partial [Acidobacteria bacterium]|nr:hypothetical protein [Acidobacteriota bacterium]
IMAPQWGADTRFPRQELAAVLNDLCRHWQVMKKFGTNEVLVNYFYPNPLGDPTFAIAALP